MLRIVCVALMCASALSAPTESKLNQESQEKAKITPDVGDEHALLRPSPINPAVLSDPRPVDRVLSTKDTAEDLKQHEKRQILADTEPGVPIPLKKPGEVLHSEAKAPGAYSPNHRIKEKHDENKKTKRQIDDESLPKSKKPVPQSDHQASEDENIHHLAKHEAGQSDNHKPEPSVEHKSDHSKVSHSQPAHHEPHNQQNEHRPIRNTQNTSAATTAAPNAKTSEPAVPNTSQTLPTASSPNHQLHSKETKRETETKNVAATGHTNEKDEPGTVKDSNHSPIFVHPVPVSQIIKNSPAAPITHAAGNAKQAE